MKILYISPVAAYKKTSEAARQEARALERKIKGLIHTITRNNHDVKVANSLGVAEDTELVCHGVYDAIVSAKNPQGKATKTASFSTTLHFLERMVNEGRIQRAIVLDQEFSNEEIEWAQKADVRLIRLDEDLKNICQEISIALRISLVYKKAEG